MPPVDTPPTPRTGEQRLRGWADELGVPPAVGRFGGRMLDVSPGTTTVRVPLRPELLLPGGRTSSAVPALLSDVGLTTSVVSTLPDARAVTTISMTVDLLGPTPAEGGLTAVCLAAPFRGGVPQHATGTLTDDDGTPVAVVSGWFLPVEMDREGVHRRGVPQEPEAADLVDLLQLDGDLLVARDALSNVSGTLHGGVGALAVTLAAERALGPGARLLSAACSYERPTPRGASAHLEAHVLKRGRRTSTVEAVLRTPEGKEAVRARVVALSAP